MSEIAFQGERGAFSEAAARLLAPSARLRPCATFEEAFASGTCVVPIENSLAGSIHRNYDLMLRHRLHIAGEARLRIVHNLIAPKSTALKDVRRVLSHPVALAQCERFFRKNRRLVAEPAYDTAGSLKIIREKGLADAAAIAGAQAAKTYGMRILKREIEDDPQNYTRFFLLTRRPRKDPKADKTSIVFSLKNEPGSLFKALSVFARRRLDLSKIESRPIQGKPWEYWFYVDFLANAYRPPGDRALKELARHAEFLRVLGCYRSAATRRPAGRRRSS